MAKVKYGGGIQDLRGSIAGQTHSRNTYGNYIRQKISPVQPRTPRQLAIRSLFTTLSRRYSTLLTDQQQEAWRKAAASTPVRNVFGDSITLTGINLYNRLNSLRLLQGLPPLDDPPPVEEIPPVENWQVLYDGTSLKVSFSPPLSPYAIAIWATEPVSPGVAFVTHKLRLLTILSPRITPPIDITDTYLARYGALTPAHRVYVAGEFLSPNGWKGPRALGSVRLLL